MFEIFYVICGVISTIITYAIFYSSEMGVEDDYIIKILIFIISAMINIIWPIVILAMIVIFSVDYIFKKIRG